MVRGRITPELRRPLSPALGPGGRTGGTPCAPPAVDGAAFVSEALEIQCEKSDREGEPPQLQIKQVKRDWRAVYRKDGLRGLAKEALHSPVFDNAMCAVVLANSVCMAMEQSQRLQGKDTGLFDTLEHVYLTVYALELALNVYAYGRSAWHSHWVKFDAALVVTGVLSSLVTLVASSTGGGGGKNPMMKMMVLRMVRLLRLARLARTLRLFAQCQELWLLARGLLNSFTTAFYTLLFGAVLLFVVGCMAVELLPLTLLHDGTAERNEVIKVIIEENFSNLPNTMLTLIQFITFDNVVYIYKPLIEEDPMLALFFIIVLLLVGVVFMNLVTAIIVNSGLEQTLQDKNMKKVAMEQQRRQLLQDLERAFHRMDVNDSGTLSRKELNDIDQQSLAVLEAYLGLENLAQVFDVLDVEGDGEISISEFCDGITSIVLTETQPEVKRIERLTESLSRSLRRQEESQKALVEGLGDVMGAVERLQRRLERFATDAEDVLGEAETPTTAATPLEVVNSPTAAAAAAVAGASVADSTGGCGASFEEAPAWAARVLAELSELKGLVAREASAVAGFRALGEIAEAAGLKKVGEEKPAEALLARLEEADWEPLPRSGTPVFNAQQPAQSLGVPAMLLGGSSHRRGPSDGPPYSPCRGTVPPRVASRDPCGPGSGVVVQEGPRGDPPRAPAGWTRGP